MWLTAMRRWAEVAREALDEPGKVAISSKGNADWRVKWLACVGVNFFPFARREETNQKL